MHAHLRAHGRESRKEAYNHSANLRQVLGQQWPASAELEVIAAQIRSLTEGIKRLEQEICELAKQLKGYKCLKSIKVIGDYSASVLLSIIGEVKEFADEDKLASYFGIVPKVADSNQTQHHGPITKRGSGKALVAVARKFLGIIYRTLKEGWVFSDFPNFVLAE